MNLENLVRKLARSDYYQMIYSRKKEMPNLRLFNNDTDFTSVQILFLRWLNAYEVMFTDIAMNEKYINEEIIEDNIRSEAYLVYRNWKNKKENKKEDNKVKDVFNRSKVPSIVFTEE